MEKRGLALGGCGCLADYGSLGGLGRFDDFGSFTGLGALGYNDALIHFGYLTCSGSF